MGTESTQEQPKEITQPEKRVKMFMVFIGRAKHYQDDRAWFYHEVDLDNNNGGKLVQDCNLAHTYLKKNVLPSITPGTIIEVDGSEDRKSIFVNTAKIVGRWQNDEDVREWTANHRAIEMEAEVAQRATKEIRKKLPLSDLEGFRIAYQNAGNCRRRAHILSMVIEAITSGNSTRSS